MKPIRLTTSAVCISAILLAAGCSQEPSASISKLSVQRQALTEGDACAGAWVQLDKSDYLPGETAVIYGECWGANEIVTLQVTHEDGTPNTGNGHEPFTATTDANGVFVATWYVDPDDSLGALFRLTIDASDGTHAETWFADAKPGGGIRIAAVGANLGNRAANVAIARGEVVGTIERLTTGSFNALSVNDLKKNYDVILVTRASSPLLNVEWLGRIELFVRAGGGFIFEDPNNVGDLGAIITGRPPGFPLTFTSDAPPPLTNGVDAGRLASPDYGIASWGTGLTEFITAPGNVEGLWGVFGSGRVVITGSALDYHGVNDAVTGPDDNYKLLVNELNWVSGDNLCAHVVCNDNNLCTVDTCNPDTGQCVFTAGHSGAICRASAGICDTAEVCNGVDPTCPADTKVAAGTTCRASAGVCDAAEVCNGESAACPADAKLTSECRASAGSCDSAEFCDGVANSCPTDAKKPAGALCRAEAGTCDVAEYCDGAADSCPTDGFQPSSTECRGSAGICDVAESCTGASPFCPTDAFQPPTVQCSAPSCADGVGVLAAHCTGAAPACPPPVTQSCNPYICGVDACRTDCTQNSHCVATFWCNAGACEFDNVPPVVTAPANVTVEATSSSGAIATYGAASAIDNLDGPLPASCSPLSGSLFPLGPTLVVCTATDANGNIGTATFTVNVVDTTPPTVTVPANITQIATSAAGNVVTYSATATDIVDGPVSVACTPPSGSTFLGTTTVTCSATDHAGNTGTKTFTITVTFATGSAFFLQPINADGSSVFKQGSTIPVKFQLAGASAGITNLVAHLTLNRYTNQVLGTESETVTSTVPDQGNTFRYDATGNLYIFNLGTKGLAVGTYRLSVDLGDGVPHVVDISLRR